MIQVKESHEKVMNHLGGKKSKWINDLCDGSMTKSVNHFLKKIK